MLSFSVPSDDHALYEIETRSGVKWFLRMPGVRIVDGRPLGFAAYLVQFPAAKKREEVQVLVSTASITKIRRAEEFPVIPGPMPETDPAKKLRLNGLA